MVEVTNPRIKKAKADAKRTKEKILEFQAKLREQMRQIKTYEDMEIVARYRNERLNEDEIATLFSQKETIGTIAEKALAEEEEENASNEENEEN